METWSIRPFSSKGLYRRRMSDRYIVCKSLTQTANWSIKLSYCLCAILIGETIASRVVNDVLIKYMDI